MKQLPLIATILLLISSMGVVMATEETEALRSLQQDINIDESVDWTPGITSVSGLTEVEKQRLTLKGEVPKPTCEIVEPPSMRLLADERFDWRDTGMVTPVRHQGSCGSCWAFSATGAIESKFLIDAGKEIDLSEQHLVSAYCNAGNCDGGWPDWVLQYAKTTGVPDEACCPYIARNTGQDSCINWQDQAYKITDYVAIKSNIDAFKQALREYGPLSVVVTVPDDWYYYRSGVYSPIRDVGWANHAVLLVGWDDSDECWFIKNSWGSGWGEQGYARVKYGNLEKYNYAYAVTGIVEHGSSPDPAGWVKPVSAVGSSEYANNYQSSMAVDNQTNTHWFSERNEPKPYITFDLGEQVTINQTRVLLHQWYIPLLIDIDVSLDGITWRTVAENIIIDGCDYVTVPITESRCQYVRMRQPNAKNYGTCTEFDVWIPEDEEDTTTSMMTFIYPDRVETIGFGDDVLTISMIRNGTKVMEWWNRGWN